jgi:hypothetical protein
MAVSGLVNLLESLANQQDQSDRPNLGAISASLTQNNAAPPATTEDTFTPSNQSISNQIGTQAAGLLQIAQFAPFTPLANLPLTQTSVPQAVQNTAPAQTPTAPNPAPPAAAVTQPNTATTAAPATAVAPTTPTSQQDQLQTLNTALSDLGLDNTQILQVDQIASVIQNFSPTAYSDIVYQLQTLSHQSTQQTAASAIGPSTTNANGGAFQLQELAITFTGRQATPANGTANENGTGQNIPANTTQVAASNLQVQAVQLTLSNNNGQTLQVQAGQPVAANVATA